MVIDIRAHSDGRFWVEVRGSELTDTVMSDLCHVQAVVGIDGINPDPHYRGRAVLTITINNSVGFGELMQLLAAKVLEAKRAGDAAEKAAQEKKAEAKATAMAATEHTPASDSGGTDQSSE